MSADSKVDNAERIISDLDHFISEMVQLRRRVAALIGESKTGDSSGSVRDAEWFGMWADREDMQGLSSREWLSQLRAEQWGR